MPYNASNSFAEHHRVTPEPAVGPAFGSIVLCEYFPGFHFVQPGLQTKKEAEHR
jgi:hypothetical protein